MQVAILMVHVVIAVALVVLILLQQGKGAEAGAARAIACEALARRRLRGVVAKLAARLLCAREHRLDSKVDRVLAREVDLGKLAVEHVLRRVVWRVARSIRHEQIEVPCNRRLKPATGRGTHKVDDANIHVPNALNAGGRAGGRVGRARSGGGRLV